MKNFDKLIDGFVETNYTNKISQRALWYLNTGFPVHLRGPAGVGKTSLAFHIAKKLGRPIIFICGSEELRETELIGEYTGVKSSLTIDNFISSVYKEEKEEKKTWKEGKLVRACKYGYTIIYDEFTRVKPEINNILLSILEEKIFVIPGGKSGTSKIKIHPDFKIIFTSNPVEYVGVYQSTNALLDRMVTIDINSIDEETEKLIVKSKSGLNDSDADKIISITNQIRDALGDKKIVSIRCSIMLATIISKQKIKLDYDNDDLRSVCLDIYRPMLSSVLDENINLAKIIYKSINNVFNNN